MAIVKPVTSSDETPRRRVLIVDDEDGIRDILGEYFQARGYVVQTASNAGDAVMAVREHRPDVVLLDIHMPGKSGLQLLPEFLAVTPPIPVIIVSANTDVALAQEALKLGAVDYVTKPCDFDYLEISVRTAALQAPGRDSSHLDKTSEDEERWAELMHAVLDAGRQMGEPGRMSMRERLENAVVMAARAARHGDTMSAEKCLREVELVLRAATELGDLPLSAALAVEAARARTPRTVTQPTMPAP